MFTRKTKQNCWMASFLFIRVNVQEIILLQSLNLLFDDTVETEEKLEEEVAEKGSPEDEKEEASRWSRRKSFEAVVELV